MPDPKDNLRLYLENAREMLEVAELNLGNDYYGSACNRAYYAIFYAANALLFAKGMSFGKHSAIISAFSSALYQDRGVRREMERNLPAHHVASPVRGL
jgi:uncharacterized protein (UPF0332 family)